MTLVMTIANRKGGVGKTTLAVALAETFVFEHRKDTVILDLDPQSSASEILLSEADYADRIENDRALPAYFRKAMQASCQLEEKTIARARHSLVGRGKVDLAIVPNSTELWDVEFEALRSGHEQKYRMAVATLIESLKAEYKVIIVDTPPGKTMAAEEAIVASDVVICPIVPERLSVWGMDRMKEYFEDLGTRRSLPPWKFVVSKLTTQFAQANAQVEHLRTNYPDNFLVDRIGLPGFGRTELVGLRQTQSIIHRIARFRDHPDDVKTLQGFYGADATQQLIRIARKLQEVHSSNA
jgi:chromosome partitioning protein